MFGFEMQLPYFRVGTVPLLKFSTAAFYLFCCMTGTIVDRVELER